MRESSTFVQPFCCRLIRGVTKVVENEEDWRRIFETDTRSTSHDTLRTNSRSGGGKPAPQTPLSQEEIIAETVDLVRCRRLSACRLLRSAVHPLAPPQTDSPHSSQRPANLHRVHREARLGTPLGARTVRTRALLQVPVARPRFKCLRLAPC
jgi:hypothetical protein